MRGRLSKDLALLGGLSLDLVGRQRLDFCTALQLRSVHAHGQFHCNLMVAKFEFVVGVLHLAIRNASIVDAATLEEVKCGDELGVFILHVVGRTHDYVDIPLLGITNDDSIQWDSFAG